VRVGVQSHYLTSPRDRVIDSNMATKKQTEEERACVGGLFASAEVGQAMLHHILHTDTCVTVTVWESPPSSASCYCVLLCSGGRIDYT